MVAKHEVWLRSNRRALLLGSLPLALLVFISCALSVVSAGWLRWMWAIVCLLSAVLCTFTIPLLFRPRLAYSDGHLLVYLRPGGPIRVPIDVVECFFLGQGSSLLPNPLGSHDDLKETSTVVVRLAESAEAWEHVEIKPAQGLWCDGYITIRGTWCEPINGELLKRLNERLVAAHRDVRSRTGSGQEVG